MQKRVLTHQVFTMYGYRCAHGSRASVRGPERSDKVRLIRAGNALDAEKLDLQSEVLERPTREVLLTHTTFLLHGILRKVALGIESRHGTRASRGHRLAIDVIRNVSCGKEPWHRGACALPC